MAQRTATSFSFQVEAERTKNEWWSRGRNCKAHETWLVVGTTGSHSQQNSDKNSVPTASVPPFKPFKCAVLTGMQVWRVKAMSQKKKQAH